MVHYSKIAILMLVLFLGFGVFAQVPQRISYQAVIRDNSGNLVISDDVSLRITIQSKTTIGGVVSDLYTETHSVTTNENGLVTLFIGGGTPVLGTFDAIVWTNNKSTRRLKVEVDPAGGTSYVLVGTSDISSTPYALLAKEALTVSNEADPDFNASPASQITTTDVNNWNSISLDDAYDNGQNIVADNGPLTVSGFDGIVSTGYYNSGVDLSLVGSGTKFIWYPKKSSFRAGTVGGAQWNNENIGAYSVALSYNTTASGDYSTALGNSTTAEGISSFATGSSSIAGGAFSSAIGSNNQASGTYSCAIGYNNIASQNASFALGSETQAKGAFSFACGDQSIANGNFSFSAGRTTQANGLYSVAFGNQTIAQGDNSIAMGYLSSANGSYSFAVGYEALASGLRAISIGRGTEATGDNAVAIGSNTLASGDYAVAMGSLTEATLNAALATGYLTKSNGQASTAMGNETTADGDASTALGNLTVASGNASLATGHTTVASGLGSTAMGVLASTNSQPGSFVIGDASTYGAGDAVVLNSAANQMMMRFAGGYMFYSNSATSVGVSLPAGGSSWASISDSTKKENFLPANGEYFLGSLSKLKLGSWNYKGQSPEQYRHYGPMAQEIYHHFGNDGIGTIGNDTTLAAADIDGIVMICLKALEQRTAQLQAKTAELDEAMRRLSAVEERMVKLEKMYSKAIEADATVYQSNNENE